MVSSLLVAVEEEGSEEAGVEMVQDVDQEVFVELEEEGKLAGHLPHTVYELEEHWTPLRVIVSVIPVTNPVTELVTKAQPLLLYQHLQHNP